MPSRRVLAGGASAVCLLATAGVTTAQPFRPDAVLEPGVGLAARFVGIFLAQLVLGGLAVAIGPDYTNNRIREIRDSPGQAFAWGLLVSIGLPIALVLVAITIVGLLITIPGLIGVAVLSLVGQAVSVVWIGSLVNGGDGRAGGQEAVVGAIILAVPAAIPILGNLVTSVIGFFGIGVVGKRVFETWQD